MKVDVKNLSARLALDHNLSDYDIWRALKTVDDALYEARRYDRPIPINLVYAREILRGARRKRSA